MSYILDALRKADAERDRGNVPGIHAQPSFGGAVPMRAPPAAKPWPWVAAGALAVGLVAAVAWYAIGPSTAPVVATLPVPPVPPVPPVSSLSPVSPVSPPMTVAPAPAAPVPAPRVQAAAPKIEAPAGERKPKPRPAPAPEPEPVAAAAEAKPTGTGEKVYTLAELPDEIRRQLPAINVGGAMYSAKPADRVLIINGQVLHEGDRISAELTLQQIRLKSALLNFKGYRYTIAY